MPDMILGKGAGFYLNATEQPWASHYRMQSYIADELPALIQREFAVSNQCAISGHSVGGHGALIMALKNRQIHQRFRVCANSEPHPGTVGAESLHELSGDDAQRWQEWDSCA